MRRMGVAALAFGILVILGPVARGQVCESSCSMYVEGHCVQYTEHCTTPDAAPPAPSFGAIAYGRGDGSYGTSYHWGSQQKAEKVAMDTCAKRGAKDCEIMVWFDRRCGAIAAGEDHVVVWGVAETEGEARGSAKSKCTAAGNKACQMLVSECSR